MCLYASLVTFWPYNLTLSLKNYQFDLMDGGGWDSYYNSIRMACYTAFFGTIAVFAGAYFVEKSRGLKTGRSILHLLSMMPMAIPGLVLGLAYIFFFNHPDNPLNFLYGTMAILVICTITHFYTVKSRCICSTGDCSLQKHSQSWGVNRCRRCVICSTNRWFWNSYMGSWNRSTLLASSSCRRNWNW